MDWIWDVREDLGSLLGFWVTDRPSTFHSGSEKCESLCLLLNFVLASGSYWPFASIEHYPLHPLYIHFSKKAPAQGRVL